MGFTGSIHPLDYAVFTVSLLISLGIGFFHAFTGGRQKTKAEYLLGNRQMKVIPVTLSLTVSYISTILFLGFPADVYSFGAEIFMITIGTSLGTAMAALVFVPVLYPLKYTSINEYLRERYDSKLMRYIGCFTAIGGMVLYSGTVYFGPSTAIESVTGLPVWVSILVCSAVSIIYTTLGGFKAVIWTDVFQSIIMVGGMVTVVIFGFLSSGGFSNVWMTNEKWHRTNFVNFDLDPRVRLTLWGAIFGKATDFLGVMGKTQVSYQRFSCMSSLRKAYMVSLGAIPLTACLCLMAFTMGWVVFAYYANLECDPVAAGILSNPNQVVPYFVVDALGFPGVTGLFLAAATAASLSSASSALNSASANLWEDVLKDLFPKFKTETETIITKCLVVMFGIIATGLAFAVAEAGGTVFQIMVTFSASLGGPSLAVFLMAVFIPWVNWKGGSIGALCGFVAALWVSFGSYSIKKHLDVLPSPTGNCSSLDELTMNTTSLAVTSLASTVVTPALETSQSWLYNLYSVSFYLYGLFSCLLSIIVAVIVSFISCPTRPSDIDPKLLHPIVRKCFSLEWKEKDDQAIIIPDPLWAQKHGHLNPASESTEF